MLHLLRRPFPCALLFLALLAGPSVNAQFRNVQIDQTGSNPEEVSIAVNPANPDNIIAGANLRYVFWSFDGGSTWSQAELGGRTYGDPCVIFDHTGRAYYAHLTVGWDAITVRTSDDGGKTWTAGVKLFGPSSDSARPGSLFNSSLQDKEWLIADMTNSAHRGNIYASWTDFTRYGSMDSKDSSVIVFARSTDSGQTWGKYVRVSDMAGDAVDSDNTMEGAVPAVGSNGEVYVAWSGPDGIYFDRSFDGGATFGKDLLVTDQPGGWDIDISGISRSNGLPVTLADISDGPNRGNVYINWVDARNGDHDVFLARSTDQGATWTPPIRVNNDQMKNGKQQFFTWGTVDPKTGELSIVYYDRRAYQSDSTDVYLARSTDGGRTFINTRISASAFVPSPFVFFGDYNCISAYNGRIRPIWTRLNAGVLTIHTALIDSTTGVRTPAGAAEGLLLRAWPNPVTQTSGSEPTISVATDRGGQVGLQVYDVMGRHVATLHDGRMEAGRHDFPFDTSRLAAGTYIVRATSPGREPRSARQLIRTEMMTVIR